MKSKPNSRAARAGLLGLAGLAGLCGCTDTTPQTAGLASFQVTATDISNAIDTFPTGAVGVSLSITAIDKQGNVDTSYNGFAQIYCTPGTILTQLGTDGNFSPAAAESISDPSDPTIQFQNGRAQTTAWAVKVFGETNYWVQDVSGSDAGVGDYRLATGVSNPIRYGYPRIQDTQITADNIQSPLNGSYVYFDESQPRCLQPPGDGGLCDPSQIYFMDMIVSSVGSDHFTVTDVNAYDLDSGVPSPGLDPNNGVYDLPGSWATMYVYTFSEPTLFVGQRLNQLSGTLQEFAGDTQLNFPSYTLNPSSRYALPQPQDVPPPTRIQPDWCMPRDANDQTSDYQLCETSVTDLHFESLESALVSLSDATMPSRWLSCDLSGNGQIPYRVATGCMPLTGGIFCNGDGGTCQEGLACVANECVSPCATDKDCVAQDSEACVDGYCMNACLCRQYCDSIPGCSELYTYNAYGQYNVQFPGSDGGIWKFNAVSKTGVPSFNPFTSPGMVVDFTSGVLEQIDAADPMWLIAPSTPNDMCCHSGSPGCTGDAGIPVCPKATAQ